MNRLFRPIRVLALAGVCLILPACIVVVDHDEEVRYVRDSDGPRRLIGVYLDSVDRSLAAQLNIEPGHATLITRVAEDSPADHAGLKRYDVVTAVDGDTNASPSRVREAIRSHKPGEELALTILRQGKPMTINVPIGK